MAAAVDLTGRRFERLTAIRIVGRDGHGKRLWLCRCDCGNEVSVNRGSLTSGNTRSCGCLKEEQVHVTSFRHGQVGTLAYKSWVAMIQRCQNPNNEKFPDYGARGLTVCERWHDFANFYADMGQRPSASYTIERVENDLGYFKENCTWANKIQQGNNRRNNHRITIDGRTQTLTEWARERGLPSISVLKRIRRGWTNERALAEPMRRTA